MYQYGCACKAARLFKIHRAVIDAQGVAVILKALSWGNHATYNKVAATAPNRPQVSLVETSLLESWLIHCNILNGGKPLFSEGEYDSWKLKSLIHIIGSQI